MLLHATRFLPRFLNILIGSQFLQSATAADSAGPASCVEAYTDGHFASIRGVRVEIQREDFEWIGFSQSFEKYWQASQTALTALKSCSSMGGRFWAVIDSSSRPLESPEVTAYLAGRRLVTSICAPMICSEKEVPDLLAIYMSGVLRIPLFQFPPGFVQVAELTFWHSFQLNFALVGMDGCGTTSMRMNLGQHPKLQFSNSPEGLFEDTTFVGSDLARFLLPPKFMRDRWLRFQKRVPSFRKNVSTGLYNALLFKHYFALLALSQMQIPVVLVVCSPSKRLAARAYHDELDMNGIVKTVEPVEPKNLFELRKLFGKDLLVLHQESLLTKATYDQIGNFIGVGAPLHFFPWYFFLCVVRCYFYYV